MSEGAKATDVVTRKEIIEQAQKLAVLISRSAEVDFFKRAEQQIKRNSKVNKLIAEIKRLQKHAVHYEHYQKEKALKEVEQKIEELNNELDQIPIVQEFKQSQKEVNDLLQMITTIISNTVTDQIIESTGGNVLTGQTGGSDPTCSSC
jgi:cell fate (sporulation/competence/biofilm development) regulator YmcA (YheA/YmcA/DUF963 family)